MNSKSYDRFGVGFAGSFHSGVTLRVTGEKKTLHWGYAMARKPTVDAPESRRLSAEEIRSGIARLNKRIGELEAFDPRSVDGRGDSRVTHLSAQIKQTVTDIFGERTPEWRNYVNASCLDTAGFNMLYETPHHEIIQGYESGRSEGLALLRSAVASLEERLEFSGHALPEHQQLHSPAKSYDIFIVHGHDDTAKQEVARFIEKAGLRAVVLHEQPNRGATVIEKLERNSNVGFAVVLLTPDDVGGPKNGEQQPRARQNVIAELFYFIAKLGRERVCPLVKGDIEIPSDIGGVVYTPMDSRGAWKQDLLRELSAVGFPVDWAKALN